MRNDYYVKNVESADQAQNNPNTSIASNVIFTVAGVALAGVAFGIGDQIFDSTSMQYLVAFGSIGITTANIRAMREKLKLKSGKTGPSEVGQQSKGKR